MICLCTDPSAWALCTACSLIIMTNRSIIMSCHKFPEHDRSDGRPEYWIKVFINNADWATLLNGNYNNCNKMQQCLRVCNLCANRTFAGDRSLESRISENNKCSYVNSWRHKEAGEPAGGGDFKLDLQLQLNPKPELKLESKFNRANAVYRAVRVAIQAARPPY